MKSRRYFLKSAGVGLVSVSAISSLACNQAPSSASLRKIGQGGGNATSDEATGDEDASLASTEFTRENPGPWAGKEDGHLPSISLTEDNKILISVGHVMEAEHYISRLRIEDEFRTVLCDKTMTARESSEASAAVTPPIPGEARRIRVISDCNLHGRWVEVFEIESYLAGFDQPEIYSETNPGRWEGKEAGHIPSIGLNENESIVISTDHGMSPEHLISSLSLSTENGETFYQKSLTAENEPIQVAAAMLPETGEMVHVRSQCNLHGTWQLIVPIDGLLAGLTDNNIYTAEQAGRFIGKEAGHLPSFAVANGLATITTEHEMVPGHYISTQQVVNEAGEIIYEKKYTANDPAANVSIPVADIQARIEANAATTFSVRSYCNKHKNWETVYAIADIDFTA